MKQFRRKRIAAYLLAIIFSCSSSMGFAFERLTKKYHEELPSVDISLVRIENRYGLVNIENWERESILIDVEVAIDHPSESRSERMLAAISIDFEKKNGVLMARTSFDEGLLKSLNSGVFGSSTKEIRIDYHVKMPKTMDLELSNKFGDVFINEITGKCHISIKYGNLKANRILHGSKSPLSSLDIGYGRATIEEVEWFKVEAKYSTITINRAKALAIMSKYSKYYIDQVSSLITDAKYDNYSLGTVTNLVGNSSYTDYRAERVEKKLDISSHYGNVRIGSIPKNFEIVQFKGSYSNLRATIAPDASYALDGNLSYGDISYNSTNRISRTEKNTSISLSGTVGSGTPRSKVKIETRYGNVKLD